MTSDHHHPEPTTRLLTLVGLPHVCGGADDGEVEEAGGDLPLGGDVDDEGEVDQADGAEDGAGHAETERAAEDSLWAWRENVSKISEMLELHPWRLDVVFAEANRIGNLS